MSEIWIADNVSELVTDTLKRYPELVGAEIACVFKEKASMKNGEPVVGKISKVNDINRVLMTEPYDLLIVVGFDAWNELNLNQKEAWVDHILAHVQCTENENTGDISYKIVGPEVAFFPHVVARHGTDWMTGLNKIKTLPLDKKRAAVPPKTRDEDEDMDDDLTSDL